VVWLLRALIVVLALSLGSNGALPLWAQLAGIEGIHVCHCAAAKHDCVCPKCNTDPHDGAVLADVVKGRCGDDEVAYVGKAFQAVLPPSAVVVPGSERLSMIFEPLRPFVGFVRVPDTPPPRGRIVSA
jgi:hypothetical protein